MYKRQVPGWDLPLHKAIMRAITPDKPSTADMTTLIDEFFRQESRDVEAGASGLEALKLLLRCLMTHFDRVDDVGEGYTMLHSFGVCTGTPLCDFCREVRVLVSAVTGSERTLVPGVDMVLEVVRMALIPTLYPGSMAMDPKPYASLDEMWKAFGDVSSNKTPAVNGEKTITSPVSSSGVRSSAPSGPRHVGHGRDQGRGPSQTPS